MKPRRSGVAPVGCLVGVVIFVFAAVMSTVIIAVGIWPGEAKLLAPILCPDDQPDAFVVADTTSVRPGETSTNFTLYCMGPAGEHTNLGFFQPFLLLTVFHGALLGVMIVLFGLLAALRRRGRGGSGPSARPQAEPTATTSPGGFDGDAAPSGPIISG